MKTTMDSLVTGVVTLSRKEDTKDGSQKSRSKI